MAASLLSLGRGAPLVGLGAPFFFSSFLFALALIIAHTAFAFWAPAPSSTEYGEEAKPLVGSNQVDDVKGADTKRIVRIASH